VKDLMVRFTAVAAVLLLASDVQGQLRVVTYNTANGDLLERSPRAGIGGTDGILKAIGDEVVNNISRPIDVLVLQEQYTSATTTQEIVDLLNTVYGAGTYNRDNVDGATLGAGRPGLIYNTQTVDLDELATISFGQVGGSAQARATLRYKLRPVGYETSDSSADITIYVNHYKASNSQSDIDRRAAEAEEVRANADALGSGAHIIFAGDYNIKGSFEEPVPGQFQDSNYSILLADGGDGQAFDPIDPNGTWITTPVTWNNNSQLKHTHTQAPALNPPDPLIGGGMDDRFDFQLVSGEMLDGEGLDYISGSYHAFGNNNTHACCNSSITSSAIPSPSLDILTKLTEVSDHLPVVADYRLPAKMGAQVAPLADPMIAGASAPVFLVVENIAPVSTDSGADELDYTYEGFGAVSGSGSDTDFALGGNNFHLLSFDTSNSGPLAGRVDVNSTSQGVADGSFTETLTASVLDHASASFDSAAAENLLSIDFGHVETTSGVQTVAVSLFNLEMTPGFTAALDLDSITSNGDTDVLTADLIPFSGLMAGAAQAFDVQFDPVRTGAFSATYALTLSDEDLPGATSGYVLTLELSGEAFLRGDMDCDGDVDFDDIDDFVLGLNDPAVYEATFGVLPSLKGDTDLDGDQDFDDIDGFVGLLSEGARGPHAVPEPACFTLVLISLLVAGWARRKCGS